MAMKFLKSNPEWVNQNILKMILDGTGEQRPIVDEQDEPWKKDQWDRWRNCGYDMKGVSWSMHYWHHLGMENASELELPLEVEGKIIEWWFCKINPCCVFPMHVDAFKTEAKNFRRFSVPMQDYIPGHVFVDDADSLVHYKAGDVFEFTDSRSWHGAGNLSMIPKVSFQFVCYDL